MKKLFFVFSALVLALSSTNASANTTEGSEGTTTKPSSAKLINVAEADSLLTKIYSKLPKIHGYIQTGYNYGNENGDNRSSFRVNRLRMLVDQKINPVFDFRIQMELFSGSSDGTAYNKKLMTVMDAFFTARLDKKINFRVGQFYTPIGFENYDISPATLELYSFSDICYRIACRNPISSPDLIDYGRDTGVLMFGSLFDSKDGDFSHLNYEISLTNGYLPTLMDDNKSKDVITRLTFRPIKNLRLLGTYAWGESQGMLANGNPEEYIPLSRYVLGAWYQADCGLNLRTEYGAMKSTVGGVSQVDESSMYFLASYKMGRFTPVARYEFYRDHNSASSPVNKNTLTGGVTYEFNKWAKMQVNYAQFFYQDEVIKSGAKTGDGNSFNLVFLIKY